MIDEWVEKMTLLFVIDSEQVDMKNRKTPMQKYRELFALNNTNFLHIELGPNEFIDRTDKLGLFSKAEAETYTFLSVKNEKDAKGTYSTESTKIRILLSPIKHTYERSVFTFMMVLGEIGGIYGAIVSIPSFFISYFIQNLLMSAVTDLMPDKKEANRWENTSIREKLE